MQSSYKWSVIAPIKYKDETGIADQGWQIGDDVRLTQLPTWLKEHFITKDTSPDISSFFEQYKYTLVAEYDVYALSEIDQQSTEQKTFRQRALEQIRLANIALWLAKPSLISYQYIFIAVYNGMNWTLVNIYDVRPFLSRLRNESTILTQEDYLNAHKLAQAISTLPSESSVWVALRTLIEAISDDWWNSRYLFLWVSIESLFGPRDARELSYRLALRISLFISDDQNTIKSAFRAVKMGYDWRSKIVHGLSLKKIRPEISELLLLVIEAILRKCLKLILLQPSTIAEFIGSNRESFLDNLVFKKVGQATV